MEGGDSLTKYPLFWCAASHPCTYGQCWLDLVVTSKRKKEKKGKNIKLGEGAYSMDPGEARGGKEGTDMIHCIYV